MTATMNESSTSKIFDEATSSPELITATPRKKSKTLTKNEKKN